MINNAHNWQQQLRHSVRDGAELLRRCGLDEQVSPQQLQAAEQFPVMVPPGLLQRIELGNPNDAILKQVLPLDAEMTPSSGYSTDPLCEQQFTPVPGLLHKYSSRVLLVLSGGCAVNCRYCFRRHFPYTEHPVDTAKWTDYIRANPQIKEVIFSGGDPLLWRNANLKTLSDELLAIEHIEMLRIHTRIPVVLPERIDDGLLQWCESLPVPLTLVLHSNCSAEFDAQVYRGLNRLSQAGVQLLNQSVLLKGVNDSLEALVDLSLALHRGGVLPYYLFMLDRVQGSAHFEVSEQRARSLHQEMCDSLPRYLVPRLARENAHADAKEVLHA